jgi:hypothetical protein
MACCTAVCSQVLHNSSYTTAAKALSRAMQSYAQHRHPFQRAADEVELALATAAVNDDAGAAAQAKEEQQHGSGISASIGEGGGTARNNLRTQESPTGETEL